jgi:hypothetical protein
VVEVVVVPLLPQTINEVVVEVVVPEFHAFLAQFLLLPQP